MSSQDLEAISRMLDGELPATPETAGQRAQLKQLLDAAGTLDVSLPDPHLDRLVSRTLGPPRRRRWPYLAAAAALLILGWAALMYESSAVGTRITELEGVVSLDGRALAEAAVAPPGASLETGAEATARIGDIVLAPNSRAVVGEPFELRAGVARVIGAGRRARVGDVEVTIDGVAWLIAEPADQVVRVTGRLEQPSSELPMRTALLALTLPAIALGATTTPAVLVTDGSATVNHASGPSRLEAGAKWLAAAPQGTAAARGTESDARIAALQAQVDGLQRRVDALSAAIDARSPVRATPVPGAPVRGSIVDGSGKPAANVAVLIVAGDRLSDTAYTDAQGRFTVEPPADADGFLYAHREGRSATAAAVRPGSNLSLQLVEPGTITARVTLNGQPATGNFQVWTGPGRVTAVLPGLWGGLKGFSGDRFQLERPASEVSLHVVNEGGNTDLAGHAVVKVEPGRDTAITIDLLPGDAAVHGTVIDAVTRKPVRKYEITLALADGSSEASYTSDRPEFGFSRRSPGERQLLITADGYKPLRQRVTLQPRKATGLGALQLEPL